jgi:hypothetical protein
LPRPGADRGPGPPDGKDTDPRTRTGQHLG